MISSHHIVSLLIYFSYCVFAEHCSGRIRLSVSTVNRTDELSGITHVTLFRKYGKHSTGSSTYGPWVRTYSKLFSCKSVLTVCSYRAQSNEICTYGRMSRGSLSRLRRCGLPYLRTVRYDHCLKSGLFPVQGSNWWFLISPPDIVSIGDCPYCVISNINVWSPVRRMLWSTSTMTSSNGKIFRVTGHLCGEFTGPRWTPRTKASDVEIWCFLWSAPK